MPSLENAHREPVTIVYGPALASYDFGAEHPLQPSRHQLTISLLDSLGWLRESGVIMEEPRPATTAELMTAHTYPYIQAVGYAQEIALGRRDPMDLRIYGLGTEDNPIFDAIRDAPLLYTGASIQAMHALLDGRAIHAYNPAGGLHHAMRARAAGFCVYNDSAAAIAAATHAGHRVAYVDLDAHHGDGVQAAFYDDPDVLTISIHESGHFLFPGTGDLEETGVSQGTGTCVNVPLPPFAGNEAILAAFDRIVAPALRLFAPSILVTQTGCDTHHADPLTDLNATLDLYPVLAERFHSLVHQVCDGRWLIVGGGGYDPADVTPRAWAAFFGTVLGHDPSGVELPASWIAESRRAGGNPPSHLLDDVAPADALPPAEKISALLSRVEETALSELRNKRLSA